MFKKPFSFNGRIRRTEYGVSMIIYSFVVAIIRLIVYSCFDFGAYIPKSDAQEANLISILISLPVLMFLWAQGAKRCHDFGKNGWWQLIPLFPIYMLFKAGDATDNEYGANPKLNSNTENF